MARINVYHYPVEDDYGIDGPTLDGWFDQDKADEFGEDTRWDGSNHISVHTGNQWDHQALYRTRQGRWVLNRYSQWQGKQEKYEFVTDDVAKEWLLRNSERAGQDDRDVRALEGYFGGVDEERGPGRPEVGPAVNVRLPHELLERVDQHAKEQAMSRAEVIRRLVSAALT